MKAAKPSSLLRAGRWERLLTCLDIVRLGLGSPVGTAYLLGFDAPHPMVGGWAMSQSMAELGGENTRTDTGTAYSVQCALP